MSTRIKITKGEYAMKIFKKMSVIMTAAAIVSSGAMHVSAAPEEATDLPIASKQPITFQQISSNWNNLMAAEQAKFPAGSYWNHYGAPVSVYSHTTTPCFHNFGSTPLHTEYCIRFTPPQGIVNEYLYAVNDGVLKECIAFTRLLAMDVFQTHDFMKFKLHENNNGRFYRYKTDRTEQYQPRIGDNVRLKTLKNGNEEGDHSVFITEVGSDWRGEYVLLAQCNADFQTCKIEWNVRMPKSELIANATYVERAMPVGDLNSDGLIDHADATAFEDTMMKDGSQHPYNWLHFDLNRDGSIDRQDYYTLQSIANSGNTQNAVILGTGDISVSHCKWRSCYNYDILFDGCYYKKNQSGGVSLVGVVDEDVKTLSVPSRIYSDKDRKYYTVTEIGRDYLGDPSFLLDKVETLILPSTITAIKRGAFVKDSQSQLKNLYFNSGDSQLTTIEADAFLGVTKMTALDLTPAAKLEVIGDRAFAQCSSLREIRLPGCSPNSRTIILKLGTTQGILPETGRIISLYSGNTDLALRRLELQDSDITRWANNTIRIYSSKTRFNDNDNDLLAQTLGYNLVRTYYKETYQWSK